MKKHATPILILFILILSVTLVARGWLDSKSFDLNVLIGANILLFILGLITFLLQLNGIKNSNPHVFVRGVMGGMIIKMFALVIALVVYINISDGSLNKRSIWAALFMYLIYLTTEVVLFMRLNRKANA